MYQKLLTQDIKKRIPPLYTYEDKPAEQVPIAVKFFSPYSSWTWYATEGQQEGDDFIFFGLTRGHETELGYFSLNELQNAKRGSLPLVERDMYFGNHTLAEAKAKQI